MQPPKAAPSHLMRLPSRLKVGKHGDWEAQNICQSTNPSALARRGLAIANLTCSAYGL